MGKKKYYEYNVDLFIWINFVEHQPFRLEFDIVLSSKFFHLLITLSFFRLLKTEDVLKKCWKPTLATECHRMKVSGYCQLFGYNILQISSFVFNRRKTLKFGTTWGWVNDYFIFGWTVHLMLEHTTQLAQIFGWFSVWTHLTLVVESHCQSAVFVAPNCKCEQKASSVFRL